MSDEDLRDLERKLAASPDDRVSRWKLVALLERTGERRRAYLELCNLARAGEVKAKGRVESWGPCPRYLDNRNVLREPLRTKPRRERMKSIEFDVSKLSGSVDDGVLHAATDERLLLVSSGGLACVRLDKLKIAWRAKTAGLRFVGNRGDDLLCVECSRDDECTSVLLDGETGKQLGPDVYSFGWPLIRGDRGVIRLNSKRESRDRYGVLDAGEDLGHPLWSITLPEPARADRPILVLPDRVYFQGRDDGSTIAAYRIDDGLEILSQNIGPQAVAELADPRGIVVQQGRRIGEFDSETLVERWRLDDVDGDPRALGDELVILHDALSVPQTLTAVERTTGKVLWSGRCDGPWIALAGDVLFELQRVEDECSVTIVAMDARTGETLYEVERDLPDKRAHVSFLPLERKLVLIVGQENRRTAVVVLEN